MIARATSAVAVALLLGATGVARADDAPATPALAAPPASISAAQMAAMMHTYTDGEQLAAIPFAGTGVLTLTAGGLLLAQGQPVERGAAWPLLGVGAIQAVAGAILAVRTPSHAAALDRLLAANPQELARVERHHLHLIRDRYQPILLIAEAVIAVAGGAMAAGGTASHGQTVEGVGIGLAAQGTAMFLLDWTVLDRARGYATGLAEFMPDSTSSP